MLTIQDVKLPTITAKQGEPPPRWHEREDYCPKCNGYKFLVDADGKATRCDCGDKSRVRVFLRHSGLGEREQAFSLDYAPTVSRHPQAVKAARHVLKSGAGMVIVFGPYGTGKSGLLMATVAEACRNGTAGQYTTAADMLASIRATFDRESAATEQAVVDRFKRVPVLALDEIEKAKLSEWAQTIYQQVIDYRWRQRHQLVTLFATNVIPTQAGGKLRFLGAHDAALGYVDDRLQDAARVPMMGDSLRGTKR